MGVTRKVLKQGNGVDKPKKGDEVTIEYTGNLYEEAKGANNDYRGKQYVEVALPSSLLKLTLPLYRFDSSKGRGDFKTAIGVGKVIRGTLDILSRAPNLSNSRS